MNMAAKAKAHANAKPTPTPTPTPTKKKKLSKFVNELMPFLTSLSSSPRFRIESTKGKLNIHFETIANDQTCNADLRMPTARIATPYIKSASRQMPAAAQQTRS